MGVHCSLSLVCVESWQQSFYRSYLPSYLWPHVSLVMDMEGTVMSTGLLRDSLKDIMEKDLLSLVMVITMDMDNLMLIKTVIIIMDLMDMRLSMITRRDLLRLNQDMDMVVTAMSTEPLRALLEVIMARDLLSLDMVTAPELAITTEVPREFKDMDMEVITKDLQSLAMGITMDMDNLMSTRTVIITMDLTDMRLSMITRRDLLRLDMVMVVIATSMSTDLTLITRLRFIIHRHITMDMARGLLSLVMALLMFMLSRRTMDMATQNLMSMDTTFIRGQLNLDMDQMKVTKKFPILHTPIMISKCTTLTKQIEIVPHFYIHEIDFL